MPESRLSHRVLVLSPYSKGSARGNAATALRTATRLEQSGATARIVQVNPDEVATAIRDFKPDVLHGIHVGHSLRGLGGDPANIPALPIVLGIGGNDLFEDLGVDPSTSEGEIHNGEARPASIEFIRLASSVVVATKAQYDAAAGLRGSSASVFLAPRFPEVGHQPIAGLEELILRSAAASGKPQGDLTYKRSEQPRPGPRPKTIAWSGALRHQKRPEWIVPIHRALRSELPDLVTIVAGPEPRNESERAFANVLAAEPGIALLPPFPGGGPGIGATGTLLGVADVVLNTSRTEGMSNFILEAIAEATPIVASNTPGNRDWITNQAMLFDTEKQAVLHLRALLLDASLAKTQAAIATTWLSETASPRAEAAAICKAHEAALSDRG